MQPDTEKVPKDDSEREEKPTEPKKPKVICMPGNHDSGIVPKGLYGDCSWDAPHGIGVRRHQNSDANHRASDIRLGGYLNCNINVIKNPFTKDAKMYRIQLKHRGASLALNRREGGKSEKRM